MLIHICCSVDSHFFISELKKLYPNENLVGFFYDSNIHPQAEYELRFLDVKRGAMKMSLKRASVAKFALMKGLEKALNSPAKSEKKALQPRF